MKWGERGQPPPHLHTCLDDHQNTGQHSCIARAHPHTSASLMPQLYWEIPSATSVGGLFCTRDGYLCTPLSEIWEAKNSPGVGPAVDQFKPMTRWGAVGRARVHAFMPVHRLYKQKTRVVLLRILSHSIQSPNSSMGKLTADQRKQLGDLAKSGTRTSASLQKQFDVGPDTVRH